MSMMSSTRAVILASLATVSCAEPPEESQEHQTKTVESASRLAGAVEGFAHELHHNEIQSVRPLTQARTGASAEDMRLTLQSIEDAKSELDLRYAEFVEDFRNSIEQR